MGLSFQVPKGDPTLEAADAALEEFENAKPPRGYLGASSIGDECWRKLWFDFRKVAARNFDAETLKRFEDGHIGEELMAARLQRVPGLVLEVRDPNTGEQFALEDVGGHFRGHADGKILGLLQAPKTRHVWEHKQVADRRLKEVEKAIKEHGEKKALKAWSPTYYGQAQVYMKAFKLKRHYMTISTPGGRKTISLRTDYHAEDAKALIKKAETIINEPTPEGLPRIAQDETFYKCRMCDYNAVCYGKTMPLATCRTCIHSTPMDNGTWNCARWGCEIPDMQAQLTGCDFHVFIPALVPLDVVDADDGDIQDWCTYRVDDLANFVNGGTEEHHIKSREIGGMKVADVKFIVDPFVEALGKPSARDQN